ncbi:unnamed protein product [Anisakis simplex]|uniref:Periodic tryptophan protein 1 homolog (inferred by orthology to a human protein) n=1 Tax=Anisakis simplex TaxID=6269 RepID=A0A0M3K4I9_ANISI|nr:unnamed protein product [Anisakis simplex]
MDRVALVSSLAWIKRGVAKHVPDKVQVNPADLRDMIQGADAETSDQSDTDEAMREGEGDAAEKQNTRSTLLFPLTSHYHVLIISLEVGGIRGSAPDSEAEEPEGDTKESVFWNIHEERSESMTEFRVNPLAGIAAFASPLDDPYITQHIESDEEEDKEDFEIKENDNLVAVAKINKGEFGLEVYVYNEEGDDWYVHHDYLLDAPPLCLEPIQYDPGADDRKGNLLAVGTMDSAVSIWDLDVVNAVEPVVVLGDHLSGQFIPVSWKSFLIAWFAALKWLCKLIELQKSLHSDGKKSARRRRKRDGTHQTHSDAVLSLSWNRVTEHVLASGSADQSVILWDLEEAKASTILTMFTDKVQCVKWHPGEASVLLSGSLNGELSLADCRYNVTEPSRRWKFEGEVEHLLWDHFNPFYFYVTTDDGKLRYMDSRSDKVVIECDAHEGGARCISQSYKIQGLIATCGADSKLKIWKMAENKLEEIHSESLSLGGLHSLGFCPDVGTVLVVGGESGDMIRMIKVDRYETVTNAFSSA